MNLRRKISFGLALAALASLPLAAESPVTQAVAEANSTLAPQWSVDALRDLSRRGIIDANLPDDGQGINREQLALISAQAFNAVRREDGSKDRIQLAQLPAMPDLPPDLGGSSLPAMGASSGDRETVFKLVQEYHDELVKLGAKGKDLTEQLVALKTSQSDLMKAFDRVVNSTGIKLNGEAVTHSLNTLVYPTNSSAKTDRVWPTVGYFDFKISARPRKEIYAEVVYRMEKVFGGFWGSLDVAGVRSFYMKGDTDIAFELGKVLFKHSPLTVWAQEDEYPNEVEVLARKRRDGMTQRQLGDNKWPLQGGRLAATVVLFDTLDLDLQALGARTAINSSKNSPLDFGITMTYDQWLIGGTARISGANDKTFSLGGSYFEINESGDTNDSITLVGQQRNQMVGADLAVNLLGDEITLTGEFVNSIYNPLYGNPRPVSWIAATDWTVGNAGNAQIKIKGKNNELNLHGVYVEDTFINYAAQTRTHDTLRDTFMDLPMGSNLFDPRRGAYGMVIGDTTISNPYETRYNDVIFATNVGRNGWYMVRRNAAGTGFVQPGGIYLTHGPREQSLPMGLATPNRAGYGLNYKGSWFDGLIQPAMFGGMYHEIWTAHDVAANALPRNYTKGGGSIKIDFASMGLPLDIKAGGMYEDTRAEPWVAFTSMTVDFDLHWEMFKKIHLLVGFEHVDYNGADFFDDGSPSAPNWTYLNFADDIYVAGLDWMVSKSTMLSVTYTYHDIWNNVMVPLAGYSGPAPSFNFGVQQYDAKMVLRF